MLGMDGHMRSCWLTLLCYASNDEGSVRYLTEEQLMLQAGVPMGGDEWERTKGVLKRFEERGMIQFEQETILLPNWGKRQSILSGYERVKRHREKNVINDNAMITVEREKEKKEEKEKKPTSSLKFLLNIPPEDLKELSEKYEASTSQIKRKAEDLKNYCEAKGRVYKNYRAFLEGALQKDFGRRVPSNPVPKVEKVPLSAEALAKLDEIRSEVKAGFKSREVTHESA